MKDIPLPMEDAILLAVNERQVRNYFQKRINISQFVWALS